MMSHKDRTAPAWAGLMRRDLAVLLGCTPADLPPVFFGAKPKPLKIGIREDLLARFPGTDSARLSRWLKIWTGNRFYLLAIASGHARHDLAGKSVVMISEDCRQHALRVLKGIGIEAMAPAPKPKRTGQNGRPILHLPSLSTARMGTTQGA